MNKGAGLGAMIGAVGGASAVHLGSSLAQKAGLIRRSSARPIGLGIGTLFGAAIGAMLGADETCGSGVSGVERHLGENGAFP